MVEGVNRQVVLAARPVGYPQEEDFHIRDAPIPTLGERQVLVRNLWLSLDPYQRGRMSDAPSYTPSAEIGDVMTGGTVGRIVASSSGDFATGEIVQGQLGWQDYAVSNGANLRKLDPSQAPISTALGILGMPGLTAYFGLFEVCRPKPGDTVVVSAASGAVGAVVGQLAKMAGCRVVGTAGTQQKIDYITGELGFDAGINYKTENVRARLEEACPDGVDVYFDNVGGFVTDAVMEVLAYRARIAICGQISQYNLETPDNGPRNLRNLLTRQATIEGFIVGRFADRNEEALRRLTRWVSDGMLKYKEDVVDGLQNAPRAFMGLMRGENFGKQLIRISEDS